MNHTGWKHRIQIFLINSTMVDQSLSVVSVKGILHLLILTFLTIIHHLLITLSRPRVILPRVHHLIRSLSLRPRLSNQMSHILRVNPIRVPIATSFVLLLSRWRADKVVVPQIEAAAWRIWYHRSGVVSLLDILVFNVIRHWRVSLALRLSDLLIRSRSCVTSHNVVELLIWHLLLLLAWKIIHIELKATMGVTTELILVVHIRWGKLVLILQLVTLVILISFRMSSIGHLGDHKIVLLLLSELIFWLVSWDVVGRWVVQLPLLMLIPWVLIWNWTSMA